MIVWQNLCEKVSLKTIQNQSLDTVLELNFNIIE